jgi:hypothetical protein
MLRSAFALSDGPVGGCSSAGNLTEQGKAKLRLHVASRIRSIPILSDDSLSHELSPVTSTAV